MLTIVNNFGSKEHFAKVIICFENHKYHRFFFTQQYAIRLLLHKIHIAHILKNNKN